MCTSMRTLMLVFVACAGLCADPVPPSLIWLGDPTGTASNEPGIIPDDNGINVSDDIFGRDGTGEYYDLSRPFDVVSPGYFMATSTLMVDISGQVCGPDTSYGCGGVFIDMSANDSFSSFSNSQAVPPVPDPAVECIPFGQTDCGGLDLPFSGTATSTIFLPAGPGFFFQALSIDAGAGGSSDLTFSFESDLVPTPEPRGYAILLALVLLGRIARKNRPTHI